MARWRIYKWLCQNTMNLYAGKGMGIRPRCWSAGNTDFVSAIAGKHGDGLFVMTSKFSQKVRDYANTDRIILIDGKRLENLIIPAFRYKKFEIKRYNQSLKQMKHMKGAFIRQ